MSLTTVLRTLMLLVCAAMLFSSTGCFATAPPPKPAKQKVDAKAQKHYYDQGIQLYSKEKFAEAKAAFEQVIENGPNTSLAAKAQENLKKIQQIMKTLDDMESK